jgi:hypothetical protein
MPVKNHRGEVRFEDRPGGSQITWDVSFDSRIPLSGGILRRMLQSTITKSAVALAVEAERRARRGGADWWQLCAPWSHTKMPRVRPARRSTLTLPTPPVAPVTSTGPVSLDAVRAKGNDTHRRFVAWNTWDSDRFTDLFLIFVHLGGVDMAVTALKRGDCRAHRVLRLGLKNTEAELRNVGSVVQRDVWNLGHQRSCA